jgi:hypothetical protein
LCVWCFVPLIDAAITDLSHCHWFQWKTSKSQSQSLDTRSHSVPIVFSTCSQHTGLCNRVFTVLYSLPTGVHQGWCTRVGFSSFLFLVPPTCIHDGRNILYRIQTTLPPLLTELIDPSTAIHDHAIHTHTFIYQH